MACSLDWVNELQGIVVEDVLVRYLPPVAVEGEPSAKKSKRKQPPIQAKGPLLFTHFGVSGPAVMDISRAVSAALMQREKGGKKEPVYIEADFLTEKNASPVGNVLAKECEASGRRKSIGLLDRHLPRRLVEAIFAQSGVDPECAPPNSPNPLDMPFSRRQRR